MSIRKIVTKTMGMVLVLAAGWVNAQTVQFNPSDLTVTEGDPISIGLEGIDFNLGMGGGGLTVNWNPGVLQLNLVTPDPLWVGLFQNFDFVPDPIDSFVGIDNTNGRVSFAWGSFTPPAGPTIGIATLDFSTVSAGLSTDTLSLYAGQPFTDATLAEYDPQPTLINGSVTVNPIPIPAAVWLFGSALVGFIGIARRKQAVA